jgi:hypothetical protein
MIYIASQVTIVPTGLLSPRALIAAGFRSIPHPFVMCAR